MVTNNPTLECDRVRKQAQSWDQMSTWVERARSLSKLGFTSYAEYRKSDIWKANERFLRAHAHYHGCLVCNRIFAVALHHLHYRDLGALSEYPNFIIPLCTRCHCAVHDLASDENISVERATHRFLEQQGRVLFVPKLERASVEPAANETEPEPNQPHARVIPNDEFVL